MRTLTIMAIIIGLASTANASLGPFSFSDGGNSLSFQDDDGVILNATPGSLPPSGNVLWGPFKTNDFVGGGAAANLSIDINNGGTALAMQKVTVQYLAITGAIRFLDLNNLSGNPDMEINISNVIVPATVDSSTTADEFMIDPANSVLTYIQDAIPQFSIAAIPEPSAFLLGGLVVGLVGVRRVIKKRSKK